jgi:hypothetical protein
MDIPSFCTSIKFKSNFNMIYIQNIVYGLEIGYIWKKKKKNMFRFKKLVLEFKCLNQNIVMNFWMMWIGPNFSKVHICIFFVNFFFFEYTFKRNVHVHYPLQKLYFIDFWIAKTWWNDINVIFCRIVEWDLVEKPMGKIMWP